MTTEAKMSLISNIWIKLIYMNKDDCMEGHKHVFDHPHLLTSGSVEIDVEGVKTTFVAPHIIFIEKGKKHKITALEDNTVGACIHAIRDGDAIEDIVDPSMIPKGTDAFNWLTNIQNAKPLVDTKTVYGLKVGDL